jgi:hypothetical protein
MDTTLTNLHVSNALKFPAYLLKAQDIDCSNYFRWIELLSNNDIPFFFTLQLLELLLQNKENRSGEAFL